MFAKLFTTPHGQCLVEKFDGLDGGYSYDLHIRFDAKSPGEGATVVVTRELYFGSTKEGEAKRDAAFAAFDQTDADTVADELV